MGMLTRYKKPGGFVQLLKLVETSGMQKQEKFLQVISEEDPHWAEAIKEKMLTLDRVLGWEKEPLAEVFSRLTDITLAISYHVLSKEQWEKISTTFSHSKLRKLTDLIDEKDPSDAKKSTAIVNILTEVRTMISDGYVRLDVVDPGLDIEDDIEEKLGDNSKVVKAINTESAQLDEKLKVGSVEDLSEVRREILQLKKKIIILGNENNVLRKGNKELRDRLERIKKLSA